MNYLMMSSFVKLSNPQAAAKKKEGGGKRAQRATSNVLGAFPQQQMQEFKEVMCEMSNFQLKNQFLRKKLFFTGIHDDRPKPGRLR